MSLDDGEKLFVWRTELGLAQWEAAAWFHCSQNGISKMEIGYEDRGGIPVKPEIKKFLDEQEFDLSLSSKAAVLRRRAQLQKTDAANALGISSYIIGEMENPFCPRQPSVAYMEWLLDD